MTRKDDGGKLRWDLLPWDCVKEVVRVLTIVTTEAKKPQPYAPDNWKTVPCARTRYFAACHRHLVAWWLGERYDPEFGIHHLAHAICCLLFCLWFDLNERADELADEQSEPNIMLFTGTPQILDEPASCHGQT